MGGVDCDPRIIIVGAGMAGVATAVILKRAGFEKFTILEKGSDVGGVWHWNRYPGLSCDVPSLVYQYSFARKPDWPRIFSTGSQIQRYIRDVVDRFSLAEHLRLNAEVVSAEFTGSGWRVAVADGTELEGDFLIAATGILHHPYVPEIPGLESFGGQVVHTARWPDETVTAGKRIAVIGTGSTGVQVVSALQPAAARVIQFTRTPQWVMWVPTALPQPRAIGALLRRFPVAYTAACKAMLAAARLYADVVTRPSWRRRLVQSYARVSLRLNVRDGRLRRLVTPTYEPLCKRQVISAEYYRAIAAANTEVVTDDIAEVTSTGIRTRGGRHHDVELIVLATGFHTHHYMRPMNLYGRDGLSIDDAWAKGPRAYRMTAIPGFPNLFTVLGPNSPTASLPLHHTAELTGHYIVGWLKRFRAGEFSTVEVSEEATVEFNDTVAEALGPTVWNTGCNSWYLNEDGSVDLWPFDLATLTEMLGEPDDRHFLLTGADS